MKLYCPIKRTTVDDLWPGDVILLGSKRVRVAKVEPAQVHRHAAYVWFSDAEPGHEVFFYRWDEEVAVIQ